MEQTEMVRDRDAEIRQLLEERREQRKQKLLVRLGRNLANPLSVSSLEALTGTLRSKKPPANVTPVKTKEPAIEATPPVPVKQESGVKPERNAQVKRTLSFRQTVTSMKRSTIANGGASLKRATSFKSVPTSVKSVPTSVKKPVAPLSSQVARVQKQKLTVPHSPNFTNRTRQPQAAKPTIQSVTKTISRKIPASNAPKLAAASSSKQTGAEGSIRVVAQINKRNSSSWMIPLTPDRKISPSKSPSSTSKANSSIHTPNVKPFIRKSFSESKAKPAVANRSTLLSRSVSTAAIRPQSSFIARKSVAPSTLGKESRLSRSTWGVPKEPSEKEKIQQWLEKRGRSIASCRHLGCLGHQLKDFQVPEKKSSSVRKSIRTFRPDNSTVENNTSDASPQLKRKSERQSVLNTTFEKEDEDEEVEEALLIPPPPPAFQNEAEEEVVDASANASNTLLNVPEEIEEKFHTPVENNKRDSVLDLTDLQEGRVDKLLETISALFDEPVYPQIKIESWIYQSEVAFPSVKSAALYWDIKARLQEKRGNTMEALDIYSEALQNKAEPLDTMKQLFDNFLVRIGSTMPTGQGTPLLKSLGVETPMIRQSRRLTVRRPLVDSSQAFNSSTVKYELKLKQVFGTLEKQSQENTSPVPTPMKKSLKTPMKFTAASNVVSVASEGPYQLVATPVRRSMRPKSMHPMAKVDEQVVYVDDLEQLSPTTLSKAVVRKNKALSSE